MLTRRIGGVEVSAIGLGAMPMSLEGRPDRAQSIETIRTAVDKGVTLIDTADAYSADDSDFGHNEELIAEALKGVDGVMVATKGGHTRTSGGGWDVNGRPEYLKAACDASLRRLGVDAIDLYQFHRPDPAVPVAESVGALAELLDAGKIKLAGVSNFDPTQIRQANEILGGRLASVQNQFSPAFRSSEPELELCAELDIAFLPWSPLGGISAAGELGARFTAFAEVGRAHGVSPQQVCLAWMLAKAPQVVPIPGSSRPASISDSADAVHLELSEEELRRLDG
ncbi:aryl-alcohol dehydrogenase-like predicted oxidoreductase [Saccharothrix ecbatanensis]|uniref:Aryl-alcohol dehydrogenase-like predicted oxidoreductase n=1 Tax=Saccharothrix ecbatanensis TaxID=1105145 RepID=A0A7W9HQX0_9PSEU|nr:aldo/keto reductase [Saccharothrix ecbatanensis]MBB5806511.1 aryl-alcohol dehydrogenase-like predicted oxidoreductase [Saccharothrix ecbatanensis]